MDERAFRNGMDTILRELRLRQATLQRLTLLFLWPNERVDLAINEANNVIDAQHCDSQFLTLTLISAERGKRTNHLSS